MPVVARSRNRSSRNVIGLAATVLVLATQGSARGQGPGPSPVATAEVVRRTVQSGQTFVGTVQPRRKSVVSSPVEQRVVEYPIDEGDRVTKGQVIARLRIEPSKIALAAAQAQLEALKQDLAELENGSRPEDVERGQATLAMAEAARSYQRLRSRRVVSLLQSRNATPEEVDEAVAQAEQAEQTYLEAKAALDLIERGPRVEKIAGARARVDAQAEEVARLNDLMEEHTIVAPFDGYVTAEFTEVGQWVAKGSPVAEIVELDEVEVTVNVLENDIRYLRVPINSESESDDRPLGTPARVELPALPDQEFTGDVVHVVPQADLRSRTFPVKVRVANPEREGVVLIKAGMFARVTLPVGSPEQALLVPKDALVLGGPSPVVFAFDPSKTDPTRGVVRTVPVVLGVADEGMIQIRGDLAPGQRVIVRGNERLRPGQAVIEPGAATPRSPAR